MRGVITLLLLLLTTPALADNNFDKIGSGRQTVSNSGTRVQLSTENIPAQRVIVTAEIDNTDTVVIGGANVVASPDTAIVGTPLAPGDSFTVMVNNVNKVYVDAQNNGEGVTYTYLSN